MAEVKFDIREGFVGCPFGVMVGSLSSTLVNVRGPFCERCIHFVSRDDAKGVVLCNHPEGRKSIRGFEY